MEERLARSRENAIIFIPLRIRAHASPVLKAIELIREIGLMEETIFSRCHSRAEWKSVQHDGRFFNWRRFDSSHLTADFLWFEILAFLVINFYQFKLIFCDLLFYDYY